MNINDIVKCVLINNIIAEGRIVKLPNHDPSLIIEGNDGTFVIHDVKNVIMTKIISNIENQAKEELAFQAYNEEAQETQESEEQFKDYDAHQDEMSLRSKTLAELKMNLISIEKNMIKEKLKSHSAGDISSNNRDMTSRYAMLPIKAIKDK
jgi:hypothetical protein